MKPVTATRRTRGFPRGKLSSDSEIRMPLYALSDGQNDVNSSRNAKFDRLELIELKKRFLICALLVLFLSFSVNGTLAYFTGEKVAHNVITSGSVDIELVEKTADGSDFVDVDGVMPGRAVSKIVYVTNTGANDAYVRIKLDMVVELAREGEADLDLIKLDLNTTDWTEKDGYYYYNKVLAPGASTEPLFTEVTFDKQMGNVFQGSTVSIDVYAQATQVANNGATALEAKGWPAAELPVA